MRIQNHCIIKINRQILHLRFISFMVFFLAFLTPPPQASANDAQMFDSFIPEPGNQSSDGITVIGYSRINKQWETRFYSSLISGTLPQPFFISIRNKPYSLQITKVQRHSDTRWACIGEIQGSGDSRFSMAYSHGTISMEIADLANKLIFKIHHHKADIYKILDVSDLHSGSCGSPQHSEYLDNSLAKYFLPHQMRTPLPLTKSAAVDTPIVHLGVIWSKIAADSAGGSDIIRAEIDRTVMEFNEILAKSNISIRWHLVFTGEVDYTESDNDATIPYLTNLPSERIHADSIASWCSLNAIDHISLIHETQFGDTAGFGSLGHSVIVREHFMTNPVITFHEWGHGMKGQHERTSFENGGEPDKYNYAYQFVDVDGNPWQTIMASESKPIDIKYFSTPQIEFNGVYIGQPEGYIDQNLNSASADNARYFNEKGGLEASSMKAPGLNLAVDRKFKTLPPDGIQEFKIRYGNTLNVPVTSVNIYVPTFDNFTFISASSGGYLKDGTIYWDNVGDLAPGEPGHATIGKELILTVKLNEGESELTYLIVQANAAEVVWAHFIGNPTKLNDASVYKPSLHTKSERSAAIVLRPGIQSSFYPGTKGFQLFSISGKSHGHFFRQTESPDEMKYVPLPGNKTGSGWHYIQYLED